MTINEIKERNRKSGGHFFDPDTMRYWNSRVSEKTHICPNGDVLFVTSEKQDGALRRYTIRRFHTKVGMITTEPGFHKFKGGNAAHYQAAKRAKEG